MPLTLSVGCAPNVLLFKVVCTDDPRRSLAELMRCELAILNKPAHTRWTDGQRRRRLVQRHFPPFKPLALTISLNAVVAAQTAHT